MSRWVASVTVVYALFAAPGSGSRATVENSETATLEPVLLIAEVKARNALWTLPLKFDTEPDSSRISSMSIPQDLVRSGLRIGVALSPGAAFAGRPTRATSKITATEATANA